MQPAKQSELSMVLSRSRLTIMTTFDHRQNAFSKVRERGECWYLLFFLIPVWIDLDSTKRMCAMDGLAARRPWSRFSRVRKGLLHRY